MQLELSNSLRPWTYVVLAGALAAAGLALRPAQWLGSSQLHSLMELGAALLALVICVTAVIRFLTRKETMHLFIGVGFLGAAIFDVQHLVATYAYDAETIASEVAGRLWSWNASRTFLGLMMLFCWWALRRERRLGQLGREPDDTTYQRLVVLTLVAFLVLSFAPLHRVYAASPLGRPDELLAGALFLLALVGFLERSGWRTSRFEHWLVLSLLVSFVGQALVMSRSVALFDTQFNVGHVLKIGSYVCVLVGLFFDFYTLSGNMQRRKEELARAVESLRREVAERERAEQEALAGRDVLAVRAQELEVSRVAAMNLLQDLEVARQTAVRAEQATRDQAARTQAILDGASDAIITISEDGSIESYNDAAERIFGYRASDVIGQNIKMLMPAPYRDEHDQYLRNYLETGVSKIIGIGREVVGRRADGTTFPMDLSVSDVALGDQRLFTGIVRDITSRKEAEEALLRSEARKTAIVETALDAVVTIDHKGRLVEFNSAAEQIFGYSREEAVGQEMAELIVPPRMRDGHRQGLERYLATGVATLMNRRLELTAMRRDGSEFPTEVSITPIEGNGPPLFTGFLRDISARKAAEQQLREAHDELAARASQIEQFNTNLSRSNEELKQFAYVASHDLQEPLRKVTAFCQMLQDEYGDSLDESAQTYIKYAVDGAMRMKTLVQDLLTYSRVETQGKPLQPTNADSACAEAIDNLAVAIAESGAEVTREPLPVINADRAQLARLFQNLIGNAIKYRGSAPPKIHVRSDTCGQDWVFRVRDNGIGIDPQYHQRVFVIFQRLHARDEYSGTGIGLAVCKRIVERAGGRIWVESQPGVGSEFCFTLPKCPDYCHTPQEGADSYDRTTEPVVGATY